MFKYGLNIFIAPSRIVLPPGDLSPEALAKGEPRRVVIPNGQKLAKPVRFDVRHDQPHRDDRIVIVAEENSEATIIEHLVSEPSDKPQTRMSSIEIIAGPGSNVTHITVQNFGRNVHDYAKKHAVVGRDASVTWLDCVFGGAFAQSHTSTELKGVGAAVTSRNIFFGTGEQQFDVYSEAIHAAPKTTSDLAGRGALGGSAKTVYRGLIRIDKGAAGCNGRQKEHTLLLSRDAEIDAIPNLEIGNDDVRCSHSASAGRIDADQLFYLMSRGVDEKTAKKVLVEGFFAPTISQMRDAGLEEAASCIIADRLINV